MGILAIDIETASPFEEPDPEQNATRCYEWLSVAMAYRGSDLDDPEAQVFFRRGGWEPKYTADLFERLIDWCDGRNIERTLTYNGAYFDLKHLLNWAEDLEESNEWTGLNGGLKASFPTHIDLAKAATARHKEELQEDQPILPDWLAYDLEDIDNDSIWYDDYDFNDDYWERLGIEDEFVRGSHVGQVLGEKYIDGVQAGLEGTKTHEELEQLLYDYSISDIVDLFALYDALGGEQLEDDFHFPVEEIEQ
jgi:DNA polymerase elongation subunit (family B)